ncbi:VOC family protein [Streptomyces sp. CBMA123]|uniref:VOC family protein n=1 Tax=Streptomyces sp. CBMA123 TaxID=1896313 RepID=UPI0016620809|nr:glyoxalase [Streptomyces sp. CBMA123]MBD0688212.1 glyoxalase [Streptomyces sp. CBMA123]
MKLRLTRLVVPLVAAAAALTAVPAASAAPSAPAKRPGSHQQFAVGPQYDTTHVYVSPGSEQAFVASWTSTFGGSTLGPVSTQVTPTPSRTLSELIVSPVGTLSVFDYTTPVPYPFGTERTGWLVTDLDQAVRAARADGAAVTVAPFADPIGRDAVVQFPGGINAQLYVHTTAPSYPAPASVPENRLYLSPDSVGAFLDSYLAFTRGRVVSDDRRADGAAIGLPGTTYRLIRLTSGFGATTVTVTDGHLPSPFGRELTGYGVPDLGATLERAKAAGASVLWGPVRAGGRDSAMVQFPGGYIAELHTDR